ncbi:hypothetical protein HanIR_Chr09g0399571 [Helianthus annuus]|nr:hypothetical protein HanIR_Chr09g0399571 [Helianthus annuus]
MGRELANLVCQLFFFLLTTRLGIIKVFGFKKVKIHGSVHMTCFWVIASITFLINTIADKHTFFSTWVKSKGWRDFGKFF